MLVNHVEPLPGLTKIKKESRISKALPTQAWQAALEPSCYCKYAKLDECNTHTTEGGVARRFEVPDP